MLTIVMKCDVSGCEGHQTADFDGFGETFGALLTSFRASGWTLEVEGAEVVRASCPLVSNHVRLLKTAPPVSDEAYAALIRWRLSGMDQDGEEAMSKVLYGFKHDFGPGQVLEKSVPEELRPAIAAYQSLDEDDQYRLVGCHVLGEEGFRIHEN